MVVVTQDHNLSKNIETHLRSNLTVNIPQYKQQNLRNASKSNLMIVAASLRAGATVTTTLWNTKTSIITQCCQRK